MDCLAMAHVAWSRDSRLASWTSLGRDLVDPTRPVLVSRIRSSPHFAAASFANFGFERTLDPRF